MSFKSFACAVLVLTGFGAPGAVLAQSADEVAPTQTVSYADLDLSSKAGADRLMLRLRLAANQVCGGTPATWELAATRWFRGCQHEALARAVQAVGNPMITARFEGAPPQPELAAAMRRHP